ncbi:RMD1 family protein [Paraglaciecola aquimarina]|uniref:RMD1 family protein n=1 Tax=Paraglaciecola aquimarina TaxID=1235557 RepID=A0ABU3SU34_9ALTE|nr:RMD1 family protein [Paraglaciecola aquimarina]MDU0353518.1 RMD1 family protein [Paraglaciecola aquimarina]
MNTNFANSTVEIMLLGNEITLSTLKQKIASIYFVKQYRDALSVSTPKGHLFVFDYGVVIAWGMSVAKKQQLLEIIEGSIQQKAAQVVDECFEFKVEEYQSVKMIDDQLTIPDGSTLTLLAVSHGLTQSATLESFERTAENTIKNNAYLSQALAKTGKMPLGRNKLSMLRGDLFSIKSDILLHFNLLDTPEFFWEYPEQEQKYLTVSKYLDLKPRVELLTMKLGTINELYEMLAAEQHHKHSSFLEWIIIILIAVEIVLFFVH